MVGEGSVVLLEEIVGDAAPRVDLVRVGMAISRAWLKALAASACWPFLKWRWPVANSASAFCEDAEDCRLRAAGAPLSASCGFFHADSPVFLLNQ